MRVPVLLFEPEEGLGARQTLVHDGHQRVKHLGCDFVVDVLILLKIHMIRLIEDLLNKLPDRVLIAEPIAIVNVLTLQVLVNSFVRIR